MADELHDITEALTHIAGDIRLIRESMERYEVHIRMALVQIAEDQALGAFCRDILAKLPVGEALHKSINKS